MYVCAFYIAAAKQTCHVCIQDKYPLTPHTYHRASKTNSEDAMSQEGQFRSRAICSSETHKLLVCNSQQAGMRYPSGPIALAEPGALGR